MIGAPRVTRTGRSSLNSTLFFLVVAILVLATRVRTDSGIDAEFVSLMMLPVCLATLVHLIRNREKNWLRGDIVFLTGFMIVSYQWPIMYALFDLTPQFGFQSQIIQVYGNYAVWLSTVALMFWFAGYSIRPAPRGDVVDQVFGLQKLVVLLLATMIAFSVTAGGGFFTGAIYKTAQDYLYLTVSGTAAYLLVFVEIFMLLAVSCVLYQRMAGGRAQDYSSAGASPLTKLFAWVGLVIFVVIFAVAGERGQLVQVVSAIGIVYSANFRPVKLWEYILLVALGALVLSMLGVLRSLISFNDMEWGQYFGYWELTSGLALSSFTTMHAIDYVQVRNEVALGYLWLSQLLGLIPFGQALYLSITGQGIGDISSAMAVTEHVFGASPHTGLGSTLVGDLYVNFGVPGLAAFSFAFGFVVRVASMWVHGRRGFVRFFVATVILGLIFYVSRSSMLFPLRTLVWGAIIAILLLRMRRLPVS